MKILCINAHGKSQQSKNKFEAFSTAISDSINRLVAIGYTRPQVIDKDLVTLDQYISDRGISFSDKDTRKVIIYVTA